MKSHNCTFESTFESKMRNSNLNKHIQTGLEAKQTKSSPKTTYICNHHINMLQQHFFPSVQSPHPIVQSPHKHHHINMLHKETNTVIVCNHHMNMLHEETNTVIAKAQVLNAAVKKTYDLLWIRNNIILP